MKKFSIIFLILFLIMLTAIIKNSTKRFEDEIFLTRENIQILKKDFESLKLEYDYLSSAENLLAFRNLYFDDELKRNNIQDINILFQNQNYLEIKPLYFNFKDE